MLVLFGRLRGLPEDVIQQEVEHWLTVFGKCKLYILHVCKGIALATSKVKLVNMYYNVLIPVLLHRICIVLRTQFLNCLSHKESVNMLTGSAARTAGETSAS